MEFFIGPLNATKFISQILIILAAGEERVRQTPINSPDFPIVVTAGPDGMIYYMLFDSDDNHETDQNLYGFSAESDRYEWMELVTSGQLDNELDDGRPDYASCTPSDWAIRYVDGELRYYYSTCAPMCDPNRAKNIYYIDEEGNNHLYYTPPLSELVPYGGADSGWWMGQFTLDDTNNVLYLASGNELGSKIFKITGAYPDSVEGGVEEIVLPRSPINGIQFVRPNFIYYASQGRVYRINTNVEDIAGSSSLVYENPNLVGCSDICCIPKLNDIAVIGEPQISIPESRMSAEAQIRILPDDMVKKGKKIDVESIESEQVLSRAAPSASKYVATQADSEQTISKQKSIAANVGS